MISSGLRVTTEVTIAWSYITRLRHRRAGRRYAIDLTDADDRALQARPAPLRAGNIPTCVAGCAGSRCRCRKEEVHDMLPYRSLSSGSNLPRPLDMSRRYCIPCHTGNGASIPGAQRVHGADDGSEQPDPARAMQGRNADLPTPSSSRPAHAGSRLTHLSNDAYQANVVPLRKTAMKQHLMPSMYVDSLPNAKQA